MSDENKIEDIDLCRAALKCNANLVVICEGKKAFWYFEQLQELADKYPDKTFPITLFLQSAIKVGEKCSKEKKKCSISFVARNIPRDKALSEL